MKISVVIPAWNEASTIAQAVENASRFADEVVVVDAGSRDETAERAAAAGAIVVTSQKGRGHQLHAGAERASGDTLLFLHADVTLNGDSRSAIVTALADPTVVGGNFYLRFEPATIAARVFTIANDLRRRALRIYYGDSAIFVRAAIYRELGGFRPLPLFEDYELVRRLERAGKTAYVRSVVATASARRFAHAPLRTLVLWTVLQMAFSLGVSPHRLARLYADTRGRTTPRASATPR
ncbi:TIGR04283 family arsenosugar biosynthesis glycosyltransferase [soil metagenome]